MRDNRRAKRTQSIQTIQVTDTMTGEAAGQVGNLSERGLMLVTKRKVLEGALFQFSFDLPDSKGKRQRIEVGAQESWSNSAQVPGTWWVGFQFIDLADEGVALLAEWLKEPSNHVD